MAKATPKPLVDAFIDLMQGLDPEYLKKVDLGKPLSPLFNRIYLALSRADDEREMSRPGRR